MWSKIIYDFLYRKRTNSRGEVTFTNRVCEPIDTVDDIHAVGADTTIQESRQTAVQGVITAKPPYNYAYNDDINHIYMEVQDISEDSESGNIFLYRKGVY